MRCLSFGLAMMLPLGAWAQDATCDVRDRSAIIRILICSPGLTTAELAQEGRLVCGDAMPCGAWMWESAEAAPDAAPENHDGLSEDQVASARAVWVAETELLIEISEVD